MRFAKYRNKKITVDGEVFDSKKEYKRWLELQEMEKNGTIQHLFRQVVFELIPPQREDGRVVERACKYIADFVYEQDGKTIVEDTKGYRTQEYIIKRKLMLFRHHLKIKEV